MADDKSSSDSKVFDVAKPGKSAASATSKPIIVTNRPVLKDPMMVDDTESEPKTVDQTAEEPVLQTSSKVKVEPIHADVTPDDPDAKPKKPTEPDKSEAEKADTYVSDEDQANEDDEANEPTNQNTQAAQEKIDEVAARKAAERATELQKLAASRKYYLPINQVEKRRNKRAAWAGVALVVLLAVAWGDIALDAGIVSIPGVKPVTHFFK